MPDLTRILKGYEADLANAGATDWPGVLWAAADALRDGSQAHAVAGRPLLLVDVAVETEAEVRFLGSLVASAAGVMATVPAHDTRTIAALSGRLGMPVETLDAPTPEPIHGRSNALGRLQRNLFRKESSPETPLDDGVEVFSAPGEGRECIEIARRVLRLARNGIAFDRVAVLLRSPQEYRSHIEEAFGRARIPVHFTQGAVRPDRAGRAFCALLRCAAQGLSARSFAEYLSLGQVPDAAIDGGPPQASPRGDLWVHPEQEETNGDADGEDAEEANDAQDGADAPVSHGRLRAPRRWEALLVDAAVIGGRERWRRRLAGLENAIRLQLARSEDDGEVNVDGVQRTLDDLLAFTTFALPIIDDLAALPASADWGSWLDRLGALASRSLRHPDRVLSVLAELAPLGTVGPIALAEVLLTLEPHLLEAAAPPTATAYGRVFVGPIEAARGLSFDTVFVPGLAEKSFPRRIVEDPILLDSKREQLPAGLPTNQDRIECERLALAIAVGAAERRICISYPRLDLQQGRSRVPSFYALETIRAASGRLLDFEELADRAGTDVAARLGWPAPTDEADAIDDAEYDLVALSGLTGDAERDAGAARYLLGANPHLARALRARAQRWSPRWTAADGLMSRSALTDGAMALQSLAVRSYSPTALQHFAACPYRFLLRSIHRIVPEERPAAIEQLDPLQRGSLIHECQFAVLGRLRDGGLLPLRPATLEPARALLDVVVAEVGAHHRDELAPAIERVWIDGLAAIHADLREWLRLLSEDGTGFVPSHFELAFGLGGGRQRDQKDPLSVPGAVALDCGIQLRGSIDLVERHPSGQVRVTDHKTGSANVRKGQVVDGGGSLQPLLYALAAEKMFNRDEVTGGRLSFCTTRGGFVEHVLPLDGRTRAIADRLADAVGDALSRSFLPAAPNAGACDRCDYRPVCGPHEAARTGRKPEGAIEALLNLRGLP